MIKVEGEGGLLASSSEISDPMVSECWDVVSLFSRPSSLRSFRYAPRKLVTLLQQLRSSTSVLDHWCKDEGGRGLPQPSVAKLLRYRFATQQAPWSSVEEVDRPSSLSCSAIRFATLLRSWPQVLAVGAIGDQS